MSVTTPTTVAAPVKPLQTRGPLTAADRCDRCGAQAYVAISIGHSGAEGTTTLSEAVPASAGTELLFCAHHKREHGDALVAKGAVVTRDDSGQLAPTNRQQGDDHA